METKDFLIIGLVVLVAVIGTAFATYALMDNGNGIDNNGTSINKTKNNITVNESSNSSSQGSSSSESSSTPNTQSSSSKGELRYVADHDTYMNAVDEDGRTRYYHNGEFVGTSDPNDPMMDQMKMHGE